MTRFLNLLTILNPSTLWNCSVLALSHLKCAFELLLHNQFSFSSHCLHNIPKTGAEELFATTRHASGSPEQCAVCLGEVGDGDEVGELRCSHVFHQACLRSWVQSSMHLTCPLCRGSLSPRPFGSASGEADFGVEVIFFKFCSFADRFSADQLDNDSWWLR